MAGKKSKKKHKATDNTIAINRQATYAFSIGEQFEAGLVLEGWEVKSLRDSRIQLKESHVSIHKGEAWLLGAHISPLLSASTHITTNTLRRKKLLLHRQQLHKLIGNVERKGYTIVPLAMYWIRGRAKLKIGLAKGKKLYDKRAAAKEQDWQRDKARIMKHS